MVPDSVHVGDCRLASAAGRPQGLGALVSDGAVQGASADSGGAVDRGAVDGIRSGGMTAPSLHTSHIADYPDCA